MDSVFILGWELGGSGTFYGRESVSSRAVFQSGLDTYILDVPMCRTVGNTLLEAVGYC